MKSKQSNAQVILSFRPSLLTRALTGATLFTLMMGLSLTGLAQDDGNGAGQGPVSTIYQSIQTKAEQAKQNYAEFQQGAQQKEIETQKKLQELEAKLDEKRSQLDEVLRDRDTAQLDITNFREIIKQYRRTNSFLSNLIEDYVRNLETSLNDAEYDTNEDSDQIPYYIQQFRQKQADESLNEVAKFAEGTDIIERSISRIEASFGGRFIKGTATADGKVKSGTFIAFGPVTYFAAEGASGMAGVAQFENNTPQPVVKDLEDPAKADAIRKVVKEGEGQLPVDPTLGTAFKVAQTKETWGEHLAKGGVTMYPLLGLGAIAVLIALIKFIQLSLVKDISDRRFNQMMDHVLAGRRDQAGLIAEKTGGPVGKMLKAGVDHSHEPKELIEEVLYERMLITRTQLMRFLPFIAVTASAAPLLGLLGTVTGMINTFKLIAVHGTGNADKLAGGISEALVTTEYGLIVAIPNLLLYAFLSRKAKGVTESMDKLAVAFLNRLESGEAEVPGEDKTHPEREEKESQEELAAVAQNGGNQGSEENSAGGDAPQSPPPAASKNRPSSGGGGSNSPSSS